MTEISFYHLTLSNIEAALPKLLEKVLNSGKRAVVRVDTEERVKTVNSILWTYDQLSFLPHGSHKEGKAESQPIWITAKHENPNKSEVVVVLDGEETPNLSRFEHCLELFDGADAAAVEVARDRWKQYTDGGHTPTYWQQSSVGKWEMKKRA